MKFGEAIGRGFRNYLNFSGRATRSEFWWFLLFVIGANIFISMALGEGMASFVASTLIIIPFFAVGWRRYHDVGRTGLWMIASIIPLLGLVLALIWLSKTGTRGGNQYGPDPLGHPNDPDYDHNDYDDQYDDEERFEPMQHRPNSAKSEDNDTSKDIDLEANEGPWAKRSNNTIPDEQPIVSHEKPIKADPGMPPKNQTTEKPGAPNKPAQFGRAASKRRGLDK